MTELERLNEQANEIQTRIREIHVREANAKYVGWVGKCFKTSKYNTYSRVLAIDAGLRCHSFSFDPESDYAHSQISRGGEYEFEEADEPWVEVSADEYYAMAEKYLQFVREQVTP